MSSEAELREMLKGAIKMRARMYYYFYQEFSAELGEERAGEIMQRAIRRGGEDAAPRFAPYAPGDLEGLKDAFLDWVPDKGAMYDPKVLRCDDEALEIHFMACPLKEAYQELGLAGEELARMLEITAAIDHGVFGGAGFDFSSQTWRPGQEGCCRLCVKPGKQD